MMHSVKRLALQVFVVLLVVAALVCIPASFVSFSSLSSGLLWSKLIASGFITILYLLLALCTLLPVHKRGMAPFSATGLVVTVATYVFVLYYVWLSDAGSDSMATWLSAKWRMVLLASFFSLSFAQAGILLRIGVQRAMIRMVRNVALLADGVLILVALILVCFVSGAGNGIFLVRISYFLFAVSWFLTAITLVGHELSKSAAPAVNKSV